MFPILNEKFIGLFDGTFGKINIVTFNLNSTKLWEIRSGAALKQVGILASLQCRKKKLKKKENIKWICELILYSLIFCCASMYNS